MRIIFSILFFVFSTTFSFANMGFGGQAGFDFGKDTDTFASVSFRTDKNPWSVSLNVHFSNPVYESVSKTDTFTFALDDWFVNERIAEHLDFYVLWGISGGFFCDFDSEADKRDFSVGTGSRFGGGLDFFFFNRHLEVFAQTVWNPYIGVKREKGDFKLLFVPLNFPCSVGIRIWN